MPVQFQANEQGMHKLGSSANLPENLLTQVSWIKNPERRSKGQQFTNLKILCSSPKVANNLIMSSGQISHLGSQIQFHKDIRAPGTCNKCQEYGHAKPNCKSENMICEKCGENHSTQECQAQSIKCMPCGSTKHPTNDTKCPQCITCEKAIMNRNLELLTPYYLTAECWTWNQPNTTPLETAKDTTQQACHPSRFANHHRNPAARPLKKQSTLPHCGFNHQPMQTGANSILLNPKKHTTTRPPSPIQAEVRPPSPQHTDNTDIPMSPNPTSISKFNFVWRIINSLEHSREL